jgi:hypothetical protein
MLHLSSRLRRAERAALRLEVLEDRVVPTLLGQQLFPADNPWNQNISSAPVAANSAAIIAHIGASTRLTPNWYADDPANGTSPLYGMPFNTVHGNSTPAVQVVIDNFPAESDNNLVPIPAGAVLEGDYQNGPNPNGAGYGENGNPNQRGDSHLLIWDADNNVAYELFGVSRPNDPTLFPNNSDVELPKTDTLWHAAQESVWDLKTNTFRTLGETSADAAGLPILPGLARPDEGLTVAQGGQGVINHALRVTLPSGDLNPQYIYPASHMLSVSQAGDHLPLGGRLRLANTPAVNALIANMPPESQILARAMQQYGLIVADIGSAMYVSGASASVDTNNNISQTWDLNDIFAVNGLEALHAGDFEVVDLTPRVTGLSASSGAPGGTITITGQNFSGAAGNLSVLFGNTPSSSVHILSDTQITAVIPNGSGTVDVRVQSGVSETDNFSSNPNANVNAPIFGYGTSAISAADLFTITADTTVTVTAVSPASGPAAGGVTITITGTNFTGATSVMFGNTQATNFVVVSSTQITATEPPGTAGQTVDITVTTPAGKSATNSADRFSFVAAPTITTQPTNVKVPAGHPATFQVVAIRDGLSYQWQKRIGSSWVYVSAGNTSGFTGATTANFTITSPVPSDAGKYRVVVSNTGGTVISQAAKLTITDMAPPGGEDFVRSGAVTKGTTANTGGFEYVFADDVSDDLTLNKGGSDNIFDTPESGTNIVAGHLADNGAQAAQGTGKLVVVTAVNDVAVTIGSSSSLEIESTLLGDSSTGTFTLSSDGAANSGTLIAGPFGISPHRQARGR